MAAYRESGEAGLAGARALRGRGTAVDPRWDEAVRLVLACMVSDSTPTRAAVLRKAEARLDELHGAGVVPRPSAATAYRPGRAGPGHQRGVRQLDGPPVDRGPAPGGLRAAAGDAAG